MKMIETIKQFIKQFEIVFHTDWSYTNMMLAVEESTFLDDYTYTPTFIKSNWMSNWSNRDDLLDYFEKLKKDLSRINANEFKVLETFKHFLTEFETVFDKDWNYTKLCLGIEEPTQKQKNKIAAFDKKLDLETIYVIAEDGSFLHPNLTEDELEMSNWGNRDLLLKYYKEIKEYLK